MKIVKYKINKSIKKYFYLYSCNLQCIVRVEEWFGLVCII